jgi:hypothetical protein
MAPNKKNPKNASGRRGKMNNDTKGFRAKPKGIKRNDEGSSYKGEPANDPRYYTVNPSLSALTAAIPVYPVLGMDMPIASTMDISYGDGNNIDAEHLYTSAIPGMMGIAMTPAFGSDMAYAPAGASFNRLCANLYSALVRDKSGTAPFDQAMVGHYLICMRSAYIFVHDLQRFLSLVTYFKANNRYYPKGIGYAIGRSGYTLTANELDGAVWQVNRLVRFLNTKYVPKMAVFQRDADLYSRIYADAQTDLAQMYIIYPRGEYIWNDTANTSEFKFFGNIIPNLPKSLAEITAAVDELIDSIQNSDAFNIINAWMTHVFGAGTGWVLGETSIGAQPMFVYDEYILAQIENLRTVHAVSSDATHLNIIQSEDDNFLRYNIAEGDLFTIADSGNTGLSADPMFNYHVSVPTEDLKLEASRLTICARSEHINSYGAAVPVGTTASGLIFSDQIPNFITIAEFNPTSGEFVQYRGGTTLTITSTGKESDLGAVVPLVSQFAHHPLIRRIQSNDDSEDMELGMMFFGDLDTVGTLSKDAFNRLSYTCTYSLFSVPGVTT